MRIYDENNNFLENPDLKKGKLVFDRRFIEHHEAIDAVKEQWHYEIVRVYPNGGQDIKRIIDVKGVEAKQAWDEYEDIQRYIPYTEEELEQMNKPSKLEILESQINALLLNQQLIEQSYRAGVNSIS